jgi:carbamoyl-phosphate synthase small subunit
MAKIVLSDGTEFSGYSFAAERSIAGEVVFNTGMVGYPESFTDPSYRGQILVLTYPLIGNYGVPGKDTDELGLLRMFESDRIHISGLVISDYSRTYSHWSSERSLADWLKEEGIPAICGVDTRALTKKLREEGVMQGRILMDDGPEPRALVGQHLVDQVSVKYPVTYGSGKRVILVDCGVKYNIIRSLARRGLQVIRVPWDYDFSGMEHEGIFISNGPGDPKACDKAIINIRNAIRTGKPIMGICLGNQLLALAAGADTYKLKYGHRSQNQPCIDLLTGRCYITSQNHGYAVKTDTLPAGWEPWWKNSNDGTNEGIRHKELPFCSVQFHPEATPGPVDTAFIFDRFKEMLG